MLMVSCIKQVKDLEMILENDWVIQEESEDVDIYYANKIMNVYDEAALELMLRMKDENESIETKAISLGSIECEAVIRKALAVGVDEGIRIDYEQTLKDSPRNIATMLYDVVKSLNPELILCGNQADNGNYGMTGQLLAEMLAWPVITKVTDIKYLDGTFHIARLCNEGIEYIKIKGPIVITVIGGENQFLRMATLHSTMEAKKKNIDVKAEIKPIEEAESIHLSIEKVCIECDFICETKKESIKEQFDKILEANELMKKVSG